MSAAFKAVIAATDIAFKALTPIHPAAKPLYWCDYCELALTDGEFDEIEHPSEQGCAGAISLWTTECGACGNECEDYIGQDIDDHGEE